MKLVKIIKNWDEPNLLRQTPGSRGVWGDLQFTLDDVNECDYLIILNFVPEKTLMKVDPRNVWAFMQEPYDANRFPWVEKGHENFETIFTHHIFNKESAAYIATQTCLPWHIDKTYDELMEMNMPDKSKGISWISSKKAFLPGHRKRMSFYDRLLADTKFEIDYFGRGICEIEDKFQGLAQYKYSIAVENSQSKHYWTEKIADCFLSYTIPIYSGCTNLGFYFPEKSFIEIDINNYRESSRIIEKTLEEDCWEDRLDALNEARELVLNQYQLFPFVSKLIEQRNNIPTEKTLISLG